MRARSARGLLVPSLRLQREIPATRYASFVRNHDQPRTRTELGGSLAKARLASFVLHRDYRDSTKRNMPRRWFDDPA